MPRFLAGVLIAAAAFGQSVTSGPRVLNFFSAVDDSDQPYAVYVPRGYDAAKRWPLVISLHGAGSNHRLNLRRVFGYGNRPGESDVSATRVFPPLGDVPFLVASPLARGTMGYQGIAEKDVYDVLGDMKRRFSVDEDRIYLTGLSMGGGGTLWLGLTRPDIWAAIAPVCPAPPRGLEELAPNALNTPVKLFQGEIDPVVPAEQTRAWHKRFQEAGVQSDYVEYRGVRHNSWDFAYKDHGIFRWFEQFRRVQKPRKVRFRTSDYAHDSAYWLRFVRLTPGTLASADAEIQEKKILVRTSGLDAFSIDPAKAPALPGAIEVDGETLRLPARRNSVLTFTRAGSKWKLGLPLPAPEGKRPGAEGPVSSALSGRHVYVYGTHDSPAADELTRRRETASRAADWSGPRSRLLLNLRVAADREIQENELADTSLVLFGSRLTNGRIAGIADKLPLHLNPSAADYGLVYVYPVDGRYVVISSGMPWWNRLDQVRRGGLPFIGPIWRTAQTFPDFILFRGGLDDVVMEGRFGNDWKLPAETAAKLRATGVVEVRP